MSSLNAAGGGSDPRGIAWAQAGLITLAAAIAAALFSTDGAVGGDTAARFVIPLRMLALVLIATALLKWSGETWRDVGLARPRSMLATSGWVVGGYICIAAAAALLTQLVFPHVGLQARTAAAFAGLQGNLGEYLYWLIPIAWGSAAFGEELLFRGFLQSRLMRAFAGAPAVLAVVAQAAIFGALHAYQGAGGAILAGVTAMIIGGIYALNGRNLWACILLHGLVDTISITAIYLGAVPPGV